MLYKKNQEKRLSRDLFEHPTAEYRGAPFWAWNTELEKDELLWQIEQLKAMGFGGYHMHPRAGMATEYLGQDFMDLVRACNEKGKAEEMLTWLYDEDRWPSGFAGGYVTRDPRHRQKLLLFTVTEKGDAVDAKAGYETGKPYLLACYDVVLSENGTLSEYRRINAADDTRGTKWYVYVCTPTPTGRYNGQTYVDTLSEAAMDEFIRVTYDAYDKAVGKDFGGSVPAIFTDEPQFSRKQTLPFATSKNDIKLPYTTDFAETFQAEYGVDLLAYLPELLWDLPDAKPSKVRYWYHDHTCERFTRAFADRCGAWCREHGIALTGHMMEEDDLEKQTAALGEAMRAYRSFGIPGIDMLCGELYYSTAKQCQSAVHQYGNEGMLSELYGVTGWDFDFRGHKFHGDWQAALGVTVRVPHLSWVSMKGSAKRDYPASISYQSAWYKEYPYIEDHFARLNTALTRGTPTVRVGVIHPVESYWLHYGPRENTADIRAQLQQNFDNVTKWLLFGTVDFDYISEALLPAQYTASADAKLHVGKMAYEAVVVPGVETLRGTTLKILEAFYAAGGKVIFLGDCPGCIDAEISDAARKLYDSSVVCAFTSVALLNALKEQRDVTVKDESGYSTQNLIYQMRRDGEGSWLFLTAGKEPAKAGRHGLLDSNPQDLRITVKGEYAPTLYNTLTGTVEPVCYEVRGGNTVIRMRRYALDSLLFRLDPATANTTSVVPVLSRKPVRTIDFKEKAGYTLSEPNVLVLDMAQLSTDGEQFAPVEEVLRIDRKLREQLHFPMADGQDMQPWLIEKETITHFPYLKFTFESEVEVPCRLAYEEVCEVTFNGESVPVTKDGYFTDKSIHTMPMPPMRRGRNELLVRVPFGKRVSLENFFLLGEFGVRVEGCISTVVAMPEKLAFGSFTDMGLPFYGANVTYKTVFEVENDCDIAVCASMYRGALIGVRLDGEDLGKIVFAPYRVCKNGLRAGKHTLELTLFGTRVNCFNGLHNCGNATWIGPSFWYTKGVNWSYEYQLKEQGILKSPVIEIYEA